MDLNFARIEMKTLAVNFRPSPLLRNGHLQTMLSVRQGIVPVFRETVGHRIPLPCGGFTQAFDDCPESWSEGDFAVLLIHGLGGCHSSGYMCRIAHQLFMLGHRVIRLDLPGSGPSCWLTDQPAHAGCSREVASTISWLKNNLGIHRWRLAGVSMGGNILLKLLAEYAMLPDNRISLQPNQRLELDIESSQFHRVQVGQLNGISIERAVVIAPSIHLSDCCESMSRGINRVYTRYFLKSLRSQVMQRREYWPAWAAIPMLPYPKTIEEFDRRYTAPLSGFANVSEYYKQASSCTLLSRITTPVVVLIDQHDPIVPAAIFDSAQWSSTTTVHCSQFGGHLGYIERGFGNGTRWMDVWIVAQLVDS